VKRWNQFIWCLVSDSLAWKTAEESNRSAHISVRRDEGRAECLDNNALFVVHGDVVKSRHANCRGLSAIIGCRKTARGDVCAVKHAPPKVNQKLKLVVAF
jgi:hypothetical protein